MDVYILSLCSGEYEDYFESPEYMYFNLSAAKDKWSDLILQEQADNAEYDIVSMAISQYDEEHLDEIFREAIGGYGVDFYDFLGSPNKYPDVLNKLTTEQQEMFLKYSELDNRYNELGGCSREYDVQYFKLGHYALQEDGSLFLHDTYYQIGDILPQED